MPCGIQQRSHTKGHYWPAFRKEHDQLVLIVENWGVAAYVSLIVFLLLAVAINYKVVDPADNMILARYGANSICIFIDDPPFSYFAAALYVPVAFLFSAFSILKFVRVYLGYHVGAVSRRTLRMFGASAVVECIGPIVFTQSLGTQPTQSELGHVVPYVIFVVGLLIQGVSTVSYYLKDAHPQTPCWLFRYMVAYLVLFGTNAACFFFIVVNAFGRDGGLMYNVQGDFAATYGAIVMKFFFFTLVTLPLGLFFMVEPYVSDIRITLSQDLTDMMPKAAAPV